MFSFILIFRYLYYFFFFFNDTATTEIYTLSLHDALPICIPPVTGTVATGGTSFWHANFSLGIPVSSWSRPRSEEHTSELQSRLHLVCRLLLEKKKIQATLSLQKYFEYVARQF